MAPELRSYQNETVAAVIAAHEQGIRSVLVEKATGTGKTTSASEVARLAVEAGEHVLVLAHRQELIDQFAARLRLFGMVPGIECGSRHSKGERVVVASVASMRGARLASFTMNEFDLIIIDEAHHAAAPGYLAIIAHFPEARVLGITATPDRADGAALSSVFDVCAYRYGIAEAVRDGYLAPVRGIQIEVEGMDLSKVRQRTIAADRSSPHATRDVVDLHPKDLGRAAIAPEAVEGVVGPLLELAGDRRTIVFAVNQAHARAIAAAISARRPGQSRAVYGSPMRAAERRAILAAHQAGEFQFLVNCMLLTEGYDDPAVACVAMARPTQSRILYAQAVGRAVRLYAGKLEALLLDFVGVSCEFSLVSPDDVLAGALTGPVSRLRVNRAGKLAPIADYVSVMRKMGFVTRVVELVRRAGGRVGKAAVSGANRVRKSWLGKLVSKLVG